MQIKRKANGFYRSEYKDFVIEFYRKDDGTWETSIKRGEWYDINFLHEVEYFNTKKEAVSFCKRNL